MHAATRSIPFVTLAAALSLAACDGSFTYGGEPTRPPTYPAPAPAPAPAPNPNPTPNPTPNPNPAPTPAPTPNPGPACAADSFVCLDSGTLSWCDAGQPVVSDCNTICRSQGYDLATGCDWSFDFDGDSCFCDYAMCDATDAPACSPGGFGVTTCENGQWVDRDCGSVCRAAGLSVSLGCGFDSVVGVDACFCDAPTPTNPPAATCTTGENVCLASDLISTCDYGREVLVDCADVCWNAGFDSVAGCGWDGAIQNDSCFCANLEPACPVGTESCGDGTCIGSGYVCDGYSDCANGGDEFGCSYNCIEGETACVDGYTVEVCEYNDWSAYDCDDVCWNAGFDLSVGCGWDTAVREDGCFCDYY